MNCEPKNERHMPHKIEPPPVNASAHCVINGTEKCCGARGGKTTTGTTMDCRRKATKDGR